MSVSPRYTSPGLEGRRELAKLKVAVSAEMRQAFGDANLCWLSIGPLLRVRGHGYSDVVIARSLVTPRGRLRWLVRTRSGGPKHRLIIVRLQLGKTCVQDFVLMPKVPRVVLYFKLTESMASGFGIVCDSAEKIVRTIWATR